jgi:hypothetical protein
VKNVHSTRRAKRPSEQSPGGRWNIWLSNKYLTHHLCPGSHGWYRLERRWNYHKPKWAKWRLDDSRFKMEQAIPDLGNIGATYEGHEL